MNPRLHIMGIILTMVDYRTNYASEITDALYNVYRSSIHIFDTFILISVRAAETPTVGMSIYKHDAKVASVYCNVLALVDAIGNDVIRIMIKMLILGIAMFIELALFANATVPWLQSKELNKPKIIRVED